MKQLLYPQEIEVFYLIPAIRKAVAVQLKRQGKGQKEIAELLGITGAAVSQYMSKKRASEIKFDDAILAEIEKSVDKIKEPMDSVRETQRILNLIRQSKLICQYHRKFTKGIPKNYCACFKK